MRPLSHTISRISGVVLGLALLGGCHVHRGANWYQPDRPARADGSGPSLVVVGNAGSDTRAGRETARRVDSLLTRERAAGRGTVLLWLGGNLEPGRGRNACEEQSGRTAPTMGTVGRNHLATGRSSFAAVGPADWRCGAPRSQLQTDPRGGPHPWVMPAFNYVVHVEADGTARVASRCKGGTCTIAAPSPTTRVSLVIIDTTPWLYPAPVETKRGAEGGAILDEMNQLLAALPPVQVPRFLVMSAAVESSGYHGQGAGAGDSTYHRLPESVKAHLVEGTFEGVLSGLDDNLQITEDLSDAVMRSQKVALGRPVFQLVSGSAAGSPEGKEAVPYFRGIAVKPDLESTRAGFAIVRVFEDTVELELQARKPQGWRVGRIQLPLRRPPHPTERTLPSMAPCMRCPEVPPDGH